MNRVWGVDFDIEAAENARYVPQDWPTILYREDGAFTNW